MNKYNVLVQYAYENEILNKIHKMSEPYGSIIPDHIQLDKVFEIKINLDLNVGVYAKKYSNGTFEPFEMIKAVEYAIKRRNSSVPYIDIVERHESKEYPTSKSIEILGYKMRISKLERDVKDKDNELDSLRNSIVLELDKSIGSVNLNELRAEIVVKDAEIKNYEMRFKLLGGRNSTKSCENCVHLPLKFIIGTRMDDEDYHDYIPCKECDQMLTSKYEFNPKSCATCEHQDNNMTAPVYFGCGLTNGAFPKENTCGRWEIKK